jgi:hypothetical protein
MTGHSNFTNPDVASRASIYAPLDESVTKQENHPNGAVWKRVVSCNSDRRSHRYGRGWSRITD